MSQRESGYQRKPLDLYETPGWVTEALLPHLPQSMSVWEPAAGSGKMASALTAGGHAVRATDIADGIDFLQTRASAQAIITNPPYTAAKAFIEHALACTQEARGVVAMLLRC